MATSECGYNRSSSVAIEILRARKILKLRVLPLERETNRSDWTITLLTNDDLGRAFVGAVRVVNFIAVNKQNDVCVLLDSARFAQIGHDGTFIRPLLQSAIQLR